MSEKYYQKEDQWYRYQHERFRKYYQHKADDPCEPDLEFLFTWPHFPKGGNRVLELGCGDGFISSFLAARELSVVGIDCSPTAIKQAKKNFKDTTLSAEFYVGDACNLTDFADGSFEFILDSHCLHCLTDYGDRERFLRECFRLLTNSGRCFISTMAEQSMHWIKEGGPDQLKYTKDKKGCYCASIVYPGDSARSSIRIFINEKILRNEAEGVGFQINRFEVFSAPEDHQDKTFLLEIEKTGDEVPP